MFIHVTPDSKYRLIACNYNLAMLQNYRIQFCVHNTVIVMFCMKQTLRLYLRIRHNSVVWAHPQKYIVIVNKYYLLYTYTLVHSRNLIILTWIYVLSISYTCMHN